MMRQRMNLMSRGERTLFLLLAVLILSGLALFGWSAHSAATSSNSSPAGVASSTPPATRASSGDSLLRDRHYVGPPQGISDHAVKKLRRGEQLDLNSADSLALLRVPGVGPAFAHRILTLGKRLGGYYTVLQLQEVYGVDEDKFLALRPWFVIKTPPKSHSFSELQADSLPWHPYLTRELASSLKRLLRRHPGEEISWELLRTQGGFSREDSIRLSPYFKTSAPKPSRQ